MKWVYPEYSKTRVRKAGETLIDFAPSYNDLSEAWRVMSNWRAAHAYPMHAMLITLRKKARDVHKHSVVVQRLKRAPSIVNKLIRFDKMKLDRMQDIGGCRAVMQDSIHAERLLKAYKRSTTRHKLHNVVDYIDQPKESGYRGIHLVYKYNGSQTQFKNLLIEIQLRSKIQHAWASAVEIIDTFTGQALKASQGETDWQEFFKYVSAEFSRLESKPIGTHVDGIDTLKEAISLEKKLTAIEKLKAFTVTTDIIIGRRSQHRRAEIKNTDYLILELEENAKQIRITQYSQKELQNASDKYLDLEKRASKEQKYDVVLVSASSIQNLKKAYPNYFADSDEFIKYYFKASNKTTPTIE
jgi:ppGpp synthetase/RelA/SpoT-type nucleotidyltranferase